MSKPFISICIPSYNRGHRALKLVEELLGYSYDESVEIIVSNNGSTKNVEGYEQIKSIEDERIVYHEFDTNHQFYGNLNQVIKMASGEFCMLLSDEDSIDIDVFNHCLNILAENRQLGLMRTKTSLHYTFCENCYAHAGEEALQSYYLVGNYISGVFYNRSVVTNEVIDELCERYESDKAYFYYPHMFIETYIELASDIYMFEELLIMEGEAEQDADKSDSNKKVLKYASYEDRLEQNSGFLKQIRDLAIINRLKLRMFVFVCSKTVSVIKLSRNSYIEQGYDWNEIVNKIRDRLIEDAKRSGIDVIVSNINEIIPVIDELVADLNAD